MVLLPLFFIDNFDVRHKGGRLFCSNNALELWIQLLGAINTFKLFHKSHSDAAKRTRVRFLSHLSTQGWLLPWSQILMA